MNTIVFLTICTSAAGLLVTFWNVIDDIIDRFGAAAGPFDRVARIRVRRDTVRILIHATCLLSSIIVSNVRTAIPTSTAVAVVNRDYTFFLVTALLLSEALFDRYDRYAVRKQVEEERRRGIIYVRKRLTDHKEGV